MAPINVEAQYGLKDEELGQLSLEVFSTSYIFQANVVPDAALSFLVFSEADTVTDNQTEGVRRGTPARRWKPGTESHCYQATCRKPQEIISILQLL